jgi:hypothetical protein
MTSKCNPLLDDEKKVLNDAGQMVLNLANMALGH